MFNSVVNSKKRINEIKGHLAASLEQITTNNDQLIRLHFKEKVLATIEGINYQIYLMTQKIESGFFYEALQLFHQAEDKFRELDNGVKNTSVVKRLRELLDSKKGEIMQLCVYFLIDQIFNTEIVENAEEIFQQIDFGGLVTNLAEGTTTNIFKGFSIEERTETTEGFNLEGDPPLESAEKQKPQKIVGRRRIKFVFSLIKNMEGFDPAGFLGFIDHNKVDAVFGKRELTPDVMFDKEVVRIFQELEKSKSVFTQGDNNVSYYNIFLCVNSIRELDPHSSIPDVKYCNSDFAV